MNVSCACDALADEYKASSVNDLPELAARVREEFVDPLNWLRHLRCDVCGQLWEERYEELGHGEVPSVRKVNEETPDPIPMHG